MKTKVQFLLDAEPGNPNQVFAFFPGERYSEHNPHQMLCYAHIGQHSACHIHYALDCKFATPEQYADLKAELESIGYDLEILTDRDI